MPTYDYECQACDHRFEKFQSITARSIHKCPECGRLKVRRLIGMGAGIIFKGSGFYQTDYRSESYKKGAEKDKKAAEQDKKGAEKDKKAAEKDKPADTKPKDSDKKAETKAVQDSSAGGTDKKEE
jgi:putative FmdB family regulatory protein